MYDQRPPQEGIGGVRIQAGVLDDDFQFPSAVLLDLDIAEVSQVTSSLRGQSVLETLRVEVAPGGGAVSSATVIELVNVHPMQAGSCPFEMHRDFDGVVADRLQLDFPDHGIACGGLDTTGKLLRHLRGVDGGWRLGFRGAGASKRDGRCAQDARQ
jgi:hypothetical protein